MCLNSFAQKALIASGVELHESDFPDLQKKSQIFKTIEGAGNRGLISRLLRGRVVTLIVLIGLERRVQR